MIDCIAKLKLELKWKLKLFLMKIIHPKVGFYTRMVLTSGVSISEIDEWIKENKNYDDNLSINEMRENVCEIEVNDWET